MGRLNIKIDRRTELLYIVALLGDYHLSQIKNFKYKTNVLKYFENFKEHPAITYFQNLNNNGFSYDALPAFILHLDEETFEIRFTFSDYLINRAGHYKNKKKGKNILEEFASLIKLFAIESNFNDFYKQNISYYNKIILNTSQIKKLLNVSKMESFFGWKQSSYNIILCPLICANGFGINIEDDEDNNLFSVIGTNWIVDDIPSFFSSKFVTGAIDFNYHEFSHSFVNPTTKLFYSEFQKNSNFLSKINTKNMHETYKNHFETIINEYLVRSIAGFLTKEVVGKDNWDFEYFVKNHKQQGFDYIEDFFRLIEKYASKRNEFETFKDLYLEILQYANK